MNKRISDKELNSIYTSVKEKLTWSLNHETRFINVKLDNLHNLCEDLIDAREALKKYEPQKPSLTEHLQKLANKHKVIFEIIVGERLVFYCDGGSLENNGIIAWTEAEPFFLFDARDFDGDLSGKFIIKPEATDE